MSRSAHPGDSLLKECLSTAAPHSRKSKRGRTNAAKISTRRKETHAPLERPQRPSKDLVHRKVGRNSKVSVAHLQPWSTWAGLKPMNAILSYCVSVRCKITHLSMFRSILLATRSTMGLNNRLILSSDQNTSAGSSAYAKMEINVLSVVAALSNLESMWIIESITR
jgi:hypothetical protein